MHCASLGEFEQGRPLLEEMKKAYPAHRFLLTFFSPSGYEVQKDYKGADWVFYLPADSPANARRFLEIVHPELVIFVKYELWYYYLKKIKYRRIPLILVSAIFRPEMSFFKWYGGLQRKMLSRFDHLFVQNNSSALLIEQIGLQHLCSISGDTRFDRVKAIADRFQPIPEIEAFTGNKNVLVAGSTWPDDETVLAGTWTQLGNSAPGLIIAPHEIKEKNITDIEKKFPGAVRFSAYKSGKIIDARVLIIDNIGMLSRLYKYGWLTYVGGGMNKNGVHNVLEAAVYGKIVLYGPFYHKYAEAVELISSGGAVSFEDPEHNGKALAAIIQALQTDTSMYIKRSAAAGLFIEKHTGATGHIIQFIQEKRLLTN